MDDLYAKESGHLSLAGSSSTVERLHEMKIKMAVEAYESSDQDNMEKQDGVERPSLIQLLATAGEIQRVWTGQTGLPEYLGFWKSENQMQT